MSPAVVHGMLAAVGIIIIAKQSHVLMGVTPSSHEPLSLLAELPYSLSHANVAIAAIGALSLAIMFTMPHIRNRIVKAIPTPIAVLAVSIPLGLWLGLGSQYLVHLPGSLLDVITFPDFSSLFTGTSLKYIIMFSLIGTIESTLSVIAIDSMDPKKRSSDLNRDLLAVGAGNLICSLVGGLPMISEIVRSKANIDAGAQTKMANFYHGIFLLVAVTLVPTLLGHIPLAALAAMLVFVGSRLASPRELFHMNEIGKDQLFLFVATMLTTLATDLLIGVSVGIALKIILLMWRGATLRSLFYPRIECSIDRDTCTVNIREAATFSSVLGIRKIVGAHQFKMKKIVIDISDVSVVDHTFLSRVAALNDELPGVELVVLGLHKMNPVSKHPFATHTRN
jgi:MFS superfamily sulfate permease-like transporter